MVGKKARISAILSNAYANPTRVGTSLRIKHPNSMVISGS